MAVAVALWYNPHSSSQGRGLSPAVPEDKMVKSYFSKNLKNFQIKTMKHSLNLIFAGEARVTHHTMLHFHPDQYINT